jgi:hypothetical protein
MKNALTGRCFHRAVDHQLLLHPMQQPLPLLMS